MQTSIGMKELVNCGVLGAQHGPRLGSQIGGIAGTVFPALGNLIGWAVGAALGFPLGFLMGVIGGAINRRWGWTLGGALPGLVLMLAQVHSYTDEIGYWFYLWLGIVPFVGGGIAGSRLGRHIERCPDLSYKLHRIVTQENLAMVPLGIRLGLVGILLLSLFDFFAALWRFSGG